MKNSNPNSAPLAEVPVAFLRRPLTWELKLFLSIDAFLSLFCLAVEAFFKYVKHQPGTYSMRNWPVLHFDYWIDFRYFIPRFQYLHQARFFSTEPAFGPVPFMYPAPCALLYEAFYSFKPHPIRIFLAVVASGVVLVAFRFYSNIRLAGLGAVAAAIFCLLTLLFSYPFWLEFLLGNMEICIWMFIVAGVWAFFHEKPLVAAIFFGIAGAIKIFPLVYLGLLVARKQYRPVFFAAGVVVVLNLIGLWMINPNLSFAWHGIQNNLNTFRHIYVIPVYGETMFDHSIFGLMKRCLSQIIPGGPSIPALTHLASAYLAFVACLGFYLYFRYIRNLPVINQVLCLCIVSILFPPISFDYTLMHLYIPWSLLVLLAIRKPSHEHIPGLGASFVCLAILMAPETEFIRHGISYGGQIKALTLIALFLIALRHRFPNLAESHDGCSPSAYTAA